MHSALTAHITLTCTSSVLILYLGFYVFKKRHQYSSIANFFLVYTAAIAIYCLGSAMGLTAVALGQMKFWTVIQYVGMPFSPPLGLLFIVKYLGMKVTKKRCIALLVIPFITLMIVATNDWHHLHYQVFEVDPVLGAPYIYQEIGTWYAVHGIYIFACMFVAFLLLISHWKETAETYRPQLVALMFGQLIPMLTAFLYLLGWTPPGVDPVPMVLWLSSLLYLWAISSSRLFTIMPIAKGAIFNSINDGVIVLDESNRMIEFNQASKNSFPKLSKEMFGKDFQQIWFDLTGDSFPLELDGIRDVQEIHLAVDQAEQIYQVRITSLDGTRNSKGHLLIFTDITELKRLQLQLEHQAYYDELTQIFNRRAFLQQCERDFAEARKKSQPFTFLLMDIDYFKKVNDTYGHHAGDQLLVHTVKVCRERLEEGQLFARYGGEEFVLALKGATLSEAEKLANDLRRSVEAQPLITAEGVVISVTLSIGVAEGLKGKADENLSRILNNADKALYSAKKAGRNQVHVYAEKGETII